MQLHLEALRKKKKAEKQHKEEDKTISIPQQLMRLKTDVKETPSPIRADKVITTYN